MANRDTLVAAVVQFVEVDYRAWSQGGIPFVGTAVSGADEFLPADMTFTVDDIVYAATYFANRWQGWTNHAYENWYAALAQNLSSRMTETPPVVPPVIAPPILPPGTVIIPPVTVPGTASMSKTLLIVGVLAFLFLLTRKTEQQ